MTRVVVVGGGAAGTMASIFAASAGAETMLLERTKDGGRKILISGGGRCNVLPAFVDETRFVSDSSLNTLRKIVRSWPLAEQIAFFEEDLDLPLVREHESAKLFPASNKARDVRDGLFAAARARGVVVRMDARVTHVTPEGAGWRIDLDGASALFADAVILASGGLSVPSTGSDGMGLRAAAQLGHTVNETYAALTPLCAKAGGFASLAGVSLPVSITARDSLRSATARGGFLFTHVGYSGPAVLDVSHVVVRARARGDDEARLTVRWTALSEVELEQTLQAKGARTLLGTLRSVVPDRLASLLLARVGVDGTQSLADLPRDQRRRVTEVLLRGPLPWTSDEGYRKAEVTGGGVSLAEIDPRTMESRIRPGLFLCGEMLDAFGPIGGYNFLWAWATGRAAGIGAAAGARARGA